MIVVADDGSTTIAEELRVVIIGCELRNCCDIIVIRTRVKQHFSQFGDACMLRNSALYGYSIPGVAKNAIVQLFADDTAVYLSEYCHFEDLEDILNQWCLAS
jgi:hypothetical protein